jgi:putative aldouronate transport system substrate-binding protein
MWDLRYLAHAFGVNANDYYIAMDETGRVSEVLTTEPWRAFLTWLRDMWAEGLLDDRGFSGLRDLATRTSNSSDKPELVYGVMMAPTPVELVPLDNLSDYVLLEPLAYEGRQVYRDLTGDVIRGTFAITSACADPAGLMAWVDTLYTREGFILAEAGMEGSEFSWNDDGTWMWDVTTDALSGLLEDVAMRAGVSMPCYADVPFQQSIDDAQTQYVVEALLRLKAIDSMPYPLVYLNEAQQARVDELILDIGRYAEYQMVWFVNGDAELTDEAWTEFCQTVREKGIDELVSIFQTAADQQQ